MRIDKKFVTVELSYHNNYCKITLLRLVHSITNMKIIYPEIRQHVFDREFRNVIIDIQPVPIPKKAASIYDVISSLNKDFPYGINYAIIYSKQKEEVYLNNKRFCENVAYNRGIFLQAFTDINKAEQWLLRYQ